MRASDADPERFPHVADYFAVLFPGTWAAVDLADLEGATEPPGFGVIGFDPGSDAYCQVTAFLREDRSAHQVIEGYASELERAGMAYEMLEVELSVGSATLVTTRRTSAEGGSMEFGMYAIESGPINAYVDCASSAGDVDGHWESIARSLVSLVRADDLQLGWPDVPLTEQQSWERISTVPGIALRQVVHLSRSDRPDLPWYVVCKDRQHGNIAIGDGGWDSHLILRALEAGHACWASRDGTSGDWDYIDWTTPEEAVQEALEAAMLEGFERNRVHQYEWECTDADGEMTVVLETDSDPPDWYGGPDTSCVLVREPTAVTGTIILPPDADLPATATWTVELQDVSKADVAATVVATTGDLVADETATEIQFVITYDPALVSVGATYALHGTIRDAEGNLLFVNDTHTPAVVEGEPRHDVELQVVSVSR